MNQPVDWSVVNNGHAIQGNPSKKSDLKVYGGSLPGRTYSVLQFHLHWGGAKSKYGYGGSEHLLNSIRYWGEMHVVMENDDFKHNETDPSEQLGVLGFFIDVC